MAADRPGNSTSTDPAHPALSATRPLFVDNRDGNTMARALKDHLAALGGEQALPFGLDIATAFFNVAGFNQLVEGLEHVGGVRLLLGAEPLPEAQRPPRQPGDPPEPAFTQKLIGDALEKQEQGLKRDRDLLPFDQETDAAVRRLLEMLHNGKIEVRRLSDQFLHAKAYVFRSAGGGSVVGSSNLTFSGLRRNMELNLGHYEDPVVGKVEGWFDELWQQAEPYDLAQLYDRLMAEYSPYLIYLRILWELYGDELEQEAEEAADIPLLTFQQHGVWRAMRIMRKCGGALVADGVGLGKTYTAGEIMRQYREHRQRVLLICPASLRDSTWQNFIDEYELFIDCVSYEELARDQQLGGDRDNLKYHLQDYQLVVIDEAHAYRNPDSPGRAQVLRQLLMGPRRDLLMLTATPVNNSLWDLYHLLRYFIKQDAFFADQGVLSLRDRFEEAAHEDPFSLSPDMLYPVIDATTVKRTRKFVKHYYQNELIPLSDGRYVPLQFPKPRASSINYGLEEVLPGFLSGLEDALLPAHGQPRLTMARYVPDSYLVGSPDQNNAGIVGLLRSGLLKRFESSIHAFHKTVARMVEQHDWFLKLLSEGKVVRKEAMVELTEQDDDEAVRELLDSPDATESPEQYDVKALQRDVESDRELLEDMRRQAAQVNKQYDPKLAELVEELARIAEQAENEAADEEDARQKRKVMIFSFYGDTVDWVYQYLGWALDHDRRLRAYAGRMAAVTGNESYDHIGRREAVFGFAPESSGAKDHQKNDRFDILVATDVLAEGQNLQQCRNIINFDLPWNPQRLVQRHGRIDRIGSSHPDVFLRTFFPDDDLNQLLDLEDRVRRKLAQAAASVGVEVAPIEEGAEGHQSFAETREEIEKLHEGKADIYEAGGTASAAQSGEEYRQELRKALEQRGDELRELPWKAGSGMAKGDDRGHMFCARVGNRVYLRFVPYPPDDAGELITELGTCLRMLECSEDTEYAMPTDLKQTAYSAWQRAQEDIFQSWEHETDPANLQPKVPKINREVADFLRQHQPPGIDQRRFERALDAVEAPCSKREQNMLRAVFNNHDHDGADKAEALVEEVERIGLEPFATPDPLPPIDREDVHLVAWMAFDREMAATH